MKRKFFFTVLVLFLSLFIACSGSKKKITFKIKGEKYFINSLNVLLPKFLERHPHLKLVLESVEDARAIASYLDGTCDIAISTRTFNSDEINYAANLNKQVQPYAVASSALSVIVAEENKLQNINLELLKKILTLQVAEWSEVIKDRVDELFRTNQREKALRLLKVSNLIYTQKIEVCVLNNLHSVHSLLLEKANIRYFSSKIRLFSTEKALIRYVATHSNAIGFVTSLAKTPRCRRLPVNNIEISQETIANNEYPLIVKHYLFIPRSYRGIEIIDLALYLRTPEVRAKLKERGFTRP